ncbi:hypothetical protein BIV57_12345 [Mangrovactinospora gilvigrisea]|uniref:Uncharacterized protein n=1 Tax=Mangrovactinospora gilvigrisea TaxID=1428644 RepID=A0A1J7BEQ0_9ACTN|nr:hypothetical protein [Mangrovactinospora gilvigrisea]OIV37118.1 hypothetical protein BIV57_12345 [Mangrovactinospora gilvigrisea]
MAVRQRWGKRSAARLRAVLAAGALVAACAGGLGAAAPADAAAGAAAHGGGHAVTVARGGPARTVPFRADRTGEALLTLTAAAPGTDWGTKGAESAVVSIYLDGRYATDLVVPGAQPLTRSLALGHVTRGTHHLRLALAADRSPAGARTARLSGLAVDVRPETGDTGIVLRNAPVLYGRNVPALGSAFQSATTDTPLLMWHEFLPATTPGHRILQYSVIWSNEDGGTDSPALMSRWGRTTDIEWVYRVEIDAAGNRVPDTGVYQAANHQTLAYAGSYENGDRPRLETCTSNNNMCDAIDDPMRFALSPLQDLPSGQPREHMMDVNPWTYPVMAKEMSREGKIESPADPSTPALSDQRDYLWIAVTHTASPTADTGNVGLTVTVRLRGDATVYRSDHGVATSAVNRDGAAATTVELPPGTTQADLAEIDVQRTPLTESAATLDVTAATRAFFLGTDDLPTPSFLSWTGALHLTPEQPTAVLWKAPDAP